MKCIDWRKVGPDKNLSHQFAAEVKNRFDALHNDITQDNIDESYTTLSKLTQEVAEEMLPKKAKSCKHQPSTEACVEQAREKLKLISAKTFHSAHFWTTWSKFLLEIFREGGKPVVPYFVLIYKKFQTWSHTSDQPFWPLSGSNLDLASWPWAYPRNYIFVKGRTPETYFTKYYNQVYLLFREVLFYLSYG